MQLSSFLACLLVLLAGHFCFYLEGLVGLTIGLLVGLAIDGTV